MSGTICILRIREAQHALLSTFDQVANRAVFRQSRSHTGRGESGQATEVVETSRRDSPRSKVTVLKGLLPGEEPGPTTCQSRAKRMASCC